MIEDERTISISMKELDKLKWWNFLKRKKLEEEIKCCYFRLNIVDYK